MITPSSVASTTSYVPGRASLIGIVHFAVPAGVVSQSIGPATASSASSVMARFSPSRLRPLISRRTCYQSERMAPTIRSSCTTLMPVAHGRLMLTCVANCTTSAV